MNFSERTYKIAELVKEMKARRVADVGCDHGLTSLLLLSGGESDYVHLIDISKTNLNKAKRLLENDYGDKISCSVCDGLKEVKENEIELAIITGMGGSEMISILGATSLDIKFLLQPMRDTQKLRIFLSENGFEIEKDFVSLLDNRFYDFIVCKRGEQKLTEKEKMFGKTNLEEKSLDFIKCLERNVMLAENILKNETKNKKRQKEISKYILDAKEIIDASSYRNNREN